MIALDKKKLFIRSVTYHYVGQVKSQKDGFLHLDPVWWVADSGRLNPALRSCKFKEYEAFPHSVWLNMDTVVDMTEIDRLPNEPEKKREVRA